MGKAAKPWLFEGVKGSCNVGLRGRCGTSWDSHVSANCKRVESRFVWQAQYFCIVFRRCVAVVVAGAALWRPPSSFCVASAALQTCRVACSTLHTLHSTLYNPHSIHSIHSINSIRSIHSTLHTLHSTLNTLHSTLYIPHFSLYTLHSTLHTLHFTLHTLHSTLYTLHSTLYTPHSTLYTPHSTLYTPHSTLYTLHFTLHTLQSTLYTLHFTLTLQNLHRTLYLHTPHSTHYTPHFIFHTFHSTLYTLHFTLHTLHSALYTSHFTLHATIGKSTSGSKKGLSKKWCFTTNLFSWWIGSVESIFGFFRQRDLLWNFLYGKLNESIHFLDT